MSRAFIDIGANLTDGMFRGVYNGTERHVDDMESVLSRAIEAGVMKIMVTAGTLDQSREALDFVKDNSMLVSTVGVHPTRANELKGDVNAHLDLLSGLIREGGDKVVAIGECGLDYDRTHFCSIEQQKIGYEAQFLLAERFKLPLFLHNRNTGGDFVKMTSENRGRFTSGVVHSFTGSMEELNELLDLGLYIGINGCSLKTEENINVASAVPLDRIMLETDSPYCEIRPSHAGFSHVRSKWPAKDKKKFELGSCVKGRCEPCHIRCVAEVVAAARGISEDELCKAAFNNTMKVFFPAESLDMGDCPYHTYISAGCSKEP
eukprot:CAMPEP_0113962850 /NCGR_PEP_ID=MMETSP0011_2-20120614/6174_1 /TAXON_ID=101924 /ORGANISM="Rhodosorus marinus" /LENGTH=318 /DNA_ID=CAMNT_0000974809 /DNA_START=597 /DNA_END=1553 /DNA_ORIENTATION=+ /assembly_acc=CAM_ASM_000156